MSVILSLAVLLAPVGPPSGDIVLLVDVSGSLSAHYDDVIEATLEIVKQGSDKDYNLTVICFGDNAVKFGPLQMPSVETVENVMEFVQFCAPFTPAVGTNIDEALGVAKTIPGDIVILSDGIWSTEHHGPDSWLFQRRVHCVGVGEFWENALLLMQKNGGGVFVWEK